MHQQPPTGPSRGYFAPQTQMQPQAQAYVQAPSQPSTSIPQPAPTTPADFAANATTPIPEPPAIPTFSHIPYFTAIQLETLYTRKRGARMSAATWQTNRDIATGFIQSVASRLGFPQRTIATAQQIYQRFHLFYSPAEFVLHEIAVASLFVASKLNDTNKKPRDLLLASYALRYPQLVKGGGSSAPDAASNPSVSSSAPPLIAGQKRKQPSSSGIEDISVDSPRPLAMAIGSVGENDIDPNILETDRKRLMALEKLILESLCFNFHSNANIALKMVIKLGRRSNLSKSFVRTAWKIAADMFRTTAPLQYPPNVIAVAALYGAALLARPPHRTNLPAKEQVGEDKEQRHEADALTKFLDDIKAVSAASSPVPPTSTAEPETQREVGAARIPLSEPFPNCDAECRIHVEDVEESIHELLDLYLACTAQLPPSLYMSSASGLGPTFGHSSSSAAATPSPLSPADPMDAFNASPSSSAGLSDPTASQSGGAARRKLKQYEYSPPPFGLVDWLNSARCSQLQSQSQQIPPVGENGPTSKQSPRKPASTASQPNSADPTLPTKELSALLTDLKIYLRGLEYDRQRADDAYLAELGILAEVSVAAMPTTTFASLQQQQEAQMLASGGLLNGPPAHSVAILLKPLDDIPAATTRTARRARK